VVRESKMKIIKFIDRITERGRYKKSLKAKVFEFLIFGVGFILLSPLVVPLILFCKKKEV
jgi:hypothetical protein